jgi:hypothetical protein
MKQTSIEWLKEQIKLTYDKEGKLPLAYILSLVKQAKEIHKEEIIDAFKSGLKSPYHQDYTIVTQDNQEGTKSGQYYQETFNK